MPRAQIAKQVEDIHTWGISGEALGAAIWSTTQVHSSGGGGYVGPYGGHVSAPTVSSSSTTHKRFFIRGDNGKESEIELANSSFGVRDGHRVTAVYAQHRESPSGWLVYLHNHDTNQSVRHTSSLRNVRGRHKKRWFFLSLVPVGFLPFGIGLVGIGAWVFFFFKYKQQFAELDAEIFRQASVLADEQMRKGAP